MKLPLSILTVVLVCTLGWSQEPPSEPVEIAREPHHTLLLKNREVRVFRLKLKPSEATFLHRHRTFYAFLSLLPVSIRNEVRGRKPVVTNIEAGEVHTSNGGSTLRERDNSSEPADLLVIEAVKTGSSSTSFSTPMASFHYHNAAFGELFETSVVRGYSMTLASEGYTEKHLENYDRLMVAVSDLKLRENVVGQPPFELQMKAGEILWIPRGLTHAATNVGTSPITFITFEFN